MAKKLVAFLVSAIMVVFVLTACAGSASSASGSGGSGGTGSAASSGASGTSDSGDPGAPGDPGDSGAASDPDPGAPSAPAGSASSGSAGTGSSSSASAVDIDSVLKNAKPGDIIHLGVVSFTDLAKGQFNKDIGWLVLSVDDKTVFVISENIIELRAYNTPRGNVTWENSTIRKWLNDTFYNGLPAAMKERVVPTLVINDDNPESKTPGGNDTEDKVFLLSTAQAKSYLTSNSKRQAGIDLTAKTIQDYKFFDERKQTLPEYVAENGGYYWWLRSPGATADTAVSVRPTGAITEGGGSVDQNGMGIRPALCLKK